MPWQRPSDPPPDFMARVRAQREHAVVRIDAETWHCGLCATDLHDGDRCESVEIVNGDPVSVWQGWGRVRVYDAPGQDGRAL